MPSPILNRINILYIKGKEICPAYILKIDSNCEKQIIMLMIPNKEKEDWHYLAIKKLSALLWGITSKCEGDFYCSNCLHSFRTWNKLKFHEKVCKNKDFCGILIPSEKNNILEFNKYMKSDKMPYIIYADIESLIEKRDGHANNPIWAFDHIENKDTLYRGKDCMKKFCESWREHVKNKIDFEEKMLTLTNEELKPHQDTKVCYIFEKGILKKLSKSINYWKVRDHCHYTSK